MQVLTVLLNLGHDVRRLGQRGVRHSARDLDTHEPCDKLAARHFVLSQYLGLNTHAVARVLQHQREVVDEEDDELSVADRLQYEKHTGSSRVARIPLLR